MLPVSRTRQGLRLLAGVVFTLTVLQWVLRLRLATEGYFRSGLEGIKAEVMDASIHLTGNWSLSWGGALLVQAGLALLTILSGIVCFRGVRSRGHRASRSD